MRLMKIVTLAILAAAAPLRAAVNVMTTTEDLADLTRQVGGDKVKVESIARGYQDPHFVEAKPSFILKLAKAELLVVVGRELEIGWLPPLIQQSRNAKIQVGADGLPRRLAHREDPRDPDRPDHPRHGRRPPARQPALLARSRQRPPHREGDRRQAVARWPRPTPPPSRQRYAEFDKRLAEAEKRWDATMAPYKGLKVVTYHRSWPNFVDRFGLDVIGYVEPRPGIPPSPGHTIDLIGEMKRQNVKILLVEPYFDLKTPQSIGRETGAKVVVLPPSVGGEKEITDYVSLFDYDINLLVATIKETGAR